MAAFTMSLTSLYATKLRPAVAQEAEQVVHYSEGCWFNNFST